MKLYEVNDMAKVGCHDCEGCSACCRGMGDTIVLDPLDIYHLTANLKCNFEQLLSTCVSLHVEDGLLLPHMVMTAEDKCFFLNKEERCNIHAFRPGLCRTFPLGRNYEDGKLTYFVVEGECQKENRTKVKVEKWLGVSDIKQNQTFLTKWHYIKKEMKSIVLQMQGKEKELNMYFLQLFYLTPYDEQEDFYEQFDNRHACMSEYLKNL